MADFEHILKSYDISDALDEIASADPPAYLRRCFAEGSSAASLAWRRVQQVAVCAMVLDAVANDRDYAFFEHELISDWRSHYAAKLARQKAAASGALKRVLERDRPEDAAATGEHERLAQRVRG